MPMIEWISDIFVAIALVCVTYMVLNHYFG